jgi:hypothetical protein
MSHWTDEDNRRHDELVARLDDEDDDEDGPGALLR